jgi:hypothetical protein
MRQFFPVLIFCIVTIALATPLAAQPSAAAIDAYNAHVVISGYNGMVSLYDAGQPQQPVLLSTIQLSGEIHSVALAGGQILAAGDTGVYILRMATPQTMAIGNSVALPAAAVAVAAAGNFGYAASGSALFLFDISSGAILDRKEYTGETITHLSLAGDFIYLLAGRTLLKVAVTDHLSAPTASLQLSADALELYADGQFVYTPQTIENAGAVLRVLSANEPRQDLNVRPLGNGQVVEGAGSGACTLYGGHMYTAGASIAVTSPVTPNGTTTAPFIQLETNFGRLWCEFASVRDSMGLAL